MDYLEYLKKMAPLWKQSMTPSPNPMVSSTQAAPSPPVGPPTGPGSATSELISRLYFGNMVKNLKNPTLSNNSNSNGNNAYADSQPQKPSSSHISAEPIADSSSGALDLSQLNHKSDSPTDLPPSRPQSGSQTSTVGSSGKSRRKGKFFLYKNGTWWLSGWHVCLPCLRSAVRTSPDSKIFHSKYPL